MSRAGERPGFLQFCKSYERKAWEWACELMDSPPTPFAKWLEDQGLDLADVKPRIVSRGSISKRLDAEGRALAASNWRAATWPKLVKLGCEKLTKPVARELTWWLCDQLVSAQDLLPNNRPLKFEGAEYLPPEMRWPYMHPLLTYTEEEVKLDQGLADQGTYYERLHKCPNQAAMNNFRTFRGNAKETQAFVKECVKLHYLEHAKKDKSPKDEVGDKEEERVASLEEMLSSV